MSIKAVSIELGEPDNNLWRVFNHYVNTEAKNSLDLRNVKRVCVDETATKRVLTTTVYLKIMIQEQLFML